MLVNDTVLKMLNDKVKEQKRDGYKYERSDLKVQAIIKNAKKAEGE